MSEQSEIKQTLDTILKNDNNMPTIKEAIFKRDVLPFLVNRNEETADLRIWLKIAGSWNRSIRVVDDSSGEELFIVPPLVGSINTEVAKSGRSSISEILQTAERKSKITEQAGREYINQQFRNKAQADGSTFLTNVRAWNFIYKRYGFDDLVNEDFGAESEKTKPEESGKVDTAGYDDL
ncbi:MAG: hypothetical protein CL582_06010 [Alteromonadaceae bacterium]|nr:hypothetical protein [Alteromonadaceae bacterium]|tara:strand:- start:3036 stop:3572 length:537 start_codon:yes stop_codon:yes gene_type:complete